ncbi:MAG: hypothetical protein V1804_04535 [Patescibacteria group bacterium]
MESQKSSPQKRQSMRAILSARYAKMEREAKKSKSLLMSKQSFVKFSLYTRDFEELYEKYRSSGYKRDLMPVIQLVDRTKSYVAGNFIWTTLGEKINSGILIKVIDENGEEHIFSSVREAERKFKLPKGVLYKPLRQEGKYKKLRVQFAI